MLCTLYVTSVKLAGIMWLQYLPELFWISSDCAGFKDLLEADRDSGHRSAGISGARNPMERLASDRASETDSQGVWMLRSLFL